MAPKQGAVAGKRREKMNLDRKMPRRDTTLVTIWSPPRSTRGERCTMIMKTAYPVRKVFFRRRSRSPGKGESRKGAYSAWRISGAGE